MIRISTTALESYRRVLQSEFGVEQELIDQIAGKPFKPTWQMEAGSAWQSLLDANETRPTIARYGAAYDMEQSGKYHFARHAVLAARKHLGPGLCEVKATRIFDVGGCPVNVVAQVDHILGLAIQENKAKFSTPDTRDYQPSLQWRFYLAVHGAQSVKYNLFDFANPTDSGYCDLRNILSCHFFPYPELEADCKRWLSLFMDWAHTRRLTEYLDREGSTPEWEAA